MPKVAGEYIGAWENEEVLSNFGNYATMWATLQDCKKQAQPEKSDNCAQGNIGSGEIIQSLGTNQVEVQVGNLKRLQKVHVVDTNAFDCVLGLDFLKGGHVNGILLHPARLIVNNQEFPLPDHLWHYFPTPKTYIPVDSNHH